MIIDKIEKDNEIRTKNTPSGKLYTTTEWISSLVAFLLIMGAFVTFFINKRIAAILYSAFFYPLIILLTASFFCGIAQALRHSYFTVKFYLSLNIITIAFAVALMVMEYKYFGVVYIVPFTFIN